MKIEARALIKIFPAPPFSGSQPLCALAGLDLEAGPGVLGVEGANGSGKTTLFKTLAGIIEADGGAILADGAAAGSGRLRELSVYCPSNPRAFYFRLSAAENLRFFGALAGLSAAQALERAKLLGDRLGLSPADLEKRFDRLSEGNMQKVSLLRSFSRRHPLLLLDEPFRGLDKRACLGLLGLIKEAGKASVVLVSSHSPELLRDAADKIIVMEAGKIKNGGEK
ncbi:MAG: ABC transporter ATP-binding protein [Elusimicrobiales bacterium]|nr:ABC transporter ATP-binding protein [Elusimicrobiales bacterium]